MIEWMNARLRGHWKPLNETARSSATLVLLFLAVINSIDLPAIVTCFQPLHSSHSSVLLAVFFFIFLSAIIFPPFHYLHDVIGSDVINLNWGGRKKHRWMLVVVIGE